MAANNIPTLPMRVPEGDTLEATISHVIGGQDAETGQLSGISALMQTRAELYESIGYHAYEQRLDAIFSGKPQS